MVEASKDGARRWSAVVAAAAGPGVNPPAFSRKRDFELRSEQDVAAREVLAGVMAVVSRVQDIHGLQEIRANRVFGLTFKTVEAALAFSSSGPSSFKVGKTTVYIAYMGVETRLLRVSRYPLSAPNEDLSQALAKFGRVLEIRDEVYQDDKVRELGICTGVRICRLEMKEKVPNILRVGGQMVSVMYPGVVQLCRKCELPGHKVADCRAVLCERCFGYGHKEDACSLPCKRCSGDHHWKMCAKQAEGQSPLGSAFAGDGNPACVPESNNTAMKTANSAEAVSTMPESPQVEVLPTIAHQEEAAPSEGLLTDAEIPVVVGNGDGTTVAVAGPVDSQAEVEEEMEANAAGSSKRDRKGTESSTEQEEADDWSSQRRTRGRRRQRKDGTASAQAVRLVSRSPLSK